VVTPDSVDTRGASTTGLVGGKHPLHTLIDIWKSYLITCLKLQNILLENNLCGTKYFTHFNFKDSKKDMLV
jgi:hypothetical protein